MTLKAINRPNSPQLPARTAPAMNLNPASVSVPALAIGIALAAAAWLPAEKINPYEALLRETGLAMPPDLMGPSAKVVHPAISGPRIPATIKAAATPAASLPTVAQADRASLEYPFTVQTVSVKGAAARDRHSTATKALAPRPEVAEVVESKSLAGGSPVAALSATPRESYESGSPSGPGHSVPLDATVVANRVAWSDHDETRHGEATVEYDPSPDRNVDLAYASVAQTDSEWQESNQAVAAYNTESAMPEPIEAPPLPAADFEPSTEVVEVGPVVESDHRFTDGMGNRVEEEYFDASGDYTPYGQTDFAPINPCPGDPVRSFPALDHDPHLQLFAVDIARRALLAHHPCAADRPIRTEDITVRKDGHYVKTYARLRWFRRDLIRPWKINRYTAEASATLVYHPDVRRVTDLSYTDNAFLTNRNFDRSSHVIASYNEGFSMRDETGLPFRSLSTNPMLLAPHTVRDTLAQPPLTPPSPAEKSLREVRRGIPVNANQ